MKSKKNNHMNLQNANTDLIEACQSGNVEQAKRAIKEGASLTYPFYIEVGHDIREWKFDYACNPKLPGRDQLDKRFGKCSDDTNGKDASDVYWIPWAVFNKHFIDVMSDLYDLIKKEEEIPSKLGTGKQGVLNGVLHQLDDDPANDIIGFWDFPLGIAAYFGHLEIVKLLIEKGAPVNAFGASALRYACINGYHQIVDHLLENGADVTALKLWALRWSFHYKRWESIASLSSYINRELEKIPDTQKKQLRGLIDQFPGRIRKKYDLIAARIDFDL